MTSADSKRRTDGRRQFLTYLDPQLIRDLKRRALDEDRPVYLLVEEMLQARLSEEASVSQPSAD